MFVKLVFLSHCLTLFALAVAQPDTLWTKTFEGNGFVWCSQMVATPDGGLAIAGESGSGNEKNSWLMKTDADGNILWEETYPQSDPYYEINAFQDLLLLSNGHYLLSGWISTPGLDDMRIMEIDQNGQIVWERIIGEVGITEYILSSDTTPDGGYIFTGAEGSLTEVHLFLLKTDEQGSIEWKKSYTFNYIDKGYSVHPTSDGGYIVSVGTDKEGPRQTMIVKTDSSGELEWVNVLDIGYNETYVVDVHETASGNYIGVSKEWIQNALTYVFYLDSSGNQIWTNGNTVGATNNWAELPGGSHIHTGYTELADDGIFLMETDQLGNPVWDLQFYQPSYSSSTSMGVTPMSDGGYSVGAMMFQSASICHFWLLRFGPSQGLNQESSSNGMDLECSCFPNPFSSAAEIRFSLLEPGDVSLKIFDMSGRIVLSRDLQNQSSGLNSISWNPGDSIPTGCYTVVVESGGEQASIRCFRMN